jgi:hypothetical protein
MTDVNTIAINYIDLWNERARSAAAKCWPRTGPSMPDMSIP